MNFDEGILKNEEKISFALRALYQRHGYAQYRMSRFEEYELYVNNKDFLISSDVITFNDTDGRLMALKPDVTLSIVRASRLHPGEVKKVGSVECQLAEDMTKCRQTLRFGSNSWNFWVYPREGRCALPDGVVETDDVVAMKSALGEGKTVLYSGPSFKSAQGQFKPVYWSARWFPVAKTSSTDAWSLR